MRHYRITLCEALVVHDEILKLRGGREGILNQSYIEASLARPYDGYHRVIYKKAAALLHGLATTHGFADANKRTAWIVTMIMLFKSGCELRVANDESIDDLVVDVVNGDVTEEQLVLWFKARLVRLF